MLYLLLLLLMRRHTFDIKQIKFEFKSKQWKSYFFYPHNWVISCCNYWFHAIHSAMFVEYVCAWWAFIISVECSPMHNNITVSYILIFNITFCTILCKLGCYFTRATRSLFLLISPCVLIKVHICSARCLTLVHCC